ncbi:ladderlectin-like [Procambarus clarkii]|uniref:ladderlectin-like n=1 Tax=Procambarus clarkii TaxID=6728 RepID=UPI003743C945
MAASLLATAMWRLLLVAAAAASAGGTDNIHQEVNSHHILSPIHENCTQSLTELLLLRQEGYLSQLLVTEKESAATLTTVVHLLTQLTDAVIPQHTDPPHKEHCTPPYTSVGKTCLLLALGDPLPWAAARQYCAARGGDLATFTDANTYAEYLAFVNTVNSENAAVGVWLGGSDEAQEGVWTWVTGELMPKGPPFWGSINGYRPEPGGGRGENCLIMYHPDKYYLHDISCGYAQSVPLCQKVYK